MVVVLTGDRGLSGAYNNASLRAGERLVAKASTATAPRLQLFTVGQKGAVRSFAFAASRSRTSFAASSIDRRYSRRAGASRPSSPAPLLAWRVPAGAPRLDALPLGGLPGGRRRTVAAPRRARSARERRAAGPSGLHRVRTRSREATRDARCRSALESEIFSALLEGAASFHTSVSSAPWRPRPTTPTSSARP